MPDFTLFQWALALLAAFGIGLSKSGFAGVSMFHVLVFVFLFGARDSTGVVLPMLVAGDVLAVIVFQQHARWEYIRRLLPPVILGVIAGWGLMQGLSDTAFKPLIGAIILLLTLLQLLRLWQPQLYEKAPHRLWFAWLMGLFAGITTMLANAAGPIMALYFVAISLPKYELVGTSAWLFFIINFVKIPFSIQLGLIHPATLLFNGALVPAIAAGLLTGRWCVKRIPQRLFDALLLIFIALAALRLIGLF